MLKIILSIFLSLCCISAFSKIYAAERGNPVFDGRTWKLVWSQKQGDNLFEEYIVDGDKIENWSELYTMQFFPGLQKITNIDAFEETQRKSLTLFCPGIKWESLSKTKDDRIWEWSTQGCKGKPDQSEIARLKKTNRGFHVWHYVIKQSPMPSKNEKLWLKKLKAIKISK